MAKHNQIGKIGEELALCFMQNKGFTLLERNYRQKWGEIDLIVHKDVNVHFVEVKTVSHETKDQLCNNEGGDFRPEDNLTPQKYQRLANTVETWIAKERYKGQYQLDLVTVHVVPADIYARVEYFPCITV